MHLKEQLDTELSQALKAKNELSVGVLRMLKSAITKKEKSPDFTSAYAKASADRQAKDQGPEISDAEIMKIITKEIAQREEATQMYKKANRTELAEKEIKEAEFLKKYLPQQLSPEELDKIIDKVIAKVGASEIKDMGKVMVKLMPELVGRAEGGKVSQLVREKLNQ